MIKGVIFIIISLVGFYFVKTTDDEDVVVENESFGRIKLYLGIALLLIFGLVSIIKEFK